MAFSGEVETGSPLKSALADLGDRCAPISGKPEIGENASNATKP
jgi:hypothetical protein